jgi:GNAT superfamily N-acetyltransferase
MAIVEYERNGHLISTNKTKLDVRMVHDYLANTSYWAQNRPLDVVKRSIQHSLCFGLYEGSQQIGFARVVTDYATFAWLCDVFILDAHQGKGLGKWLVECVFRHPDLQGLRRIMLATRDAHELYHRYADFQPLSQPEWMMEHTAQNPGAAELEKEKEEGAA